MMDGNKKMKIIKIEDSESAQPDSGCQAKDLEVAENYSTEDPNLFTIVKAEKIDQEEINLSAITKTEQIEEPMLSTWMKQEKTEENIEDIIVNVCVPSNDAEEASDEGEWPSHEDPLEISSCIPESFLQAELQVGSGSCPANPSTHLTDALETKSYPCNHSECNYSAQTKRTLREHRAKTHGESFHTCPHCDYITSLKRNLQTHLQTHQTQRKKPYTCTFNDCKYGAYTKQQLNSHLAKEHGETSLLIKCPHCEYRTSNPSNLRVHTKIHLPSGTKAYKCAYDNCSFSTNRKKQIKPHQVKVHGDQPNLKQCPHCDYAVEFTAILRRHVQTHFQPDQKLFKCSYEECTYSAATKDTLKAHQAGKHGENSLLKRCSVCTYVTGHSSSLKKHLETHRDVKSYQCSFDQCSYSAASKQHLKAHLFNKHGVGDSSGVQNCPHCGYSTVIVYLMKKHMRTHLPSSEKTYQCPYSECSYSGTTKPLYDAHLATKHGKAEFLKRCPYCEFTTGNASSVKRHIGRKHPDK